MVGGPGNPFSNIHNFDPATSIPDLSSKVIIVTGGNSGVGKESILQLAKHKPKKLYLAARSQSKFDSALEDISNIVPDASKYIHFLKIDLGSFESIKKATEDFLSQNDRLDILMNNAGIMAHPADLTTEGYEIHFGTNHMGTAFLTKLLLPIMIQTASSSTSPDVRIMNVSSLAYMIAPRPTGLPFLSNEARNKEIKTPTANHRWTYTRYGASKLANILHARKLAQLYGSKNITAVSIHPGRVSTNLLNTRFSYFNATGWFQYVADLFVGVLTVQQGALNQLWAAAVEKSQLTNGGFYVPVGDLSNDVSKGKEEVHAELADKLWEWQEGEFNSWLKENGY